MADANFLSACVDIRATVCLLMLAAVHNLTHLTECNSNENVKDTRVFCAHFLISHQWMMIIIGCVSPVLLHFGAGIVCVPYKMFMFLFIVCFCYFGSLVFATCTNVSSNEVNETKGKKIGIKCR